MLFWNVFIFFFFGKMENSSRFETFWQKQEKYNRKNVYKMYFALMMIPYISSSFMIP